MRAYAPAEIPVTAEWVDERPIDPEIMLDTVAQTPEGNARHILAYLVGGVFRADAKPSLVHEPALH
jgi:hypothetical protein